MPRLMIVRMVRAGANAMRKALLPAACLLVALPAQPPVAVATAPELGGYRVHRLFSLAVSRHGASGALRLLQDARITEPDRREHWGVDGSAWGEGDGMAPPLGKARLELFDEQGNPVASEALETLADLQEASFDGQGTTVFVLTEDGSVGAGSSNGLVTTLIDLRSGGLGRMKAQAGKGIPETLRLLETLRSSWRRVPARNGKGQDLLEVACPLGRERGDPRIVYTRYHLEGSRWIRTRRTARGLWLNEAEDSFPKRSLFP